MSLTGVPDDLKKTSAEVRSAFLDYFAARGHAVQRSASLIPRNDPTLMFVNAGMVPFKDVFTGKETRPYKRATSSQKCIRISGKHNDLENVGVTARHHTFFEMLGNFSFGDYFKEEAIAFCWELLTKGYGLPTERMIVTVFGGADGVAPDDDARAIWRKISGFGDDRIVGIGGIPGDNFWQMGETGPCGPCTEVHFYLGNLDHGAPDYSTFGQEPAPDGTGWFEVWNLVFMQFERSAAGLAPLPAPCVDTGMGLERIASVVQGVTSNYDTDLLRNLVDETSRIAGKRYGGTLADDDVSMRVVADHARTTAFLIAEGVFPERGAREYVLRRVMRRAIRHGHRLGIREPFLHRVALRVVDEMGGVYPELVDRRELIASISEQEEVRFRETIERGLGMLDAEIASTAARGSSTISGEAAFKLYDTFGFPLDLTEVIARERNFEVDQSAYDKALEAQKLRSAGSKVGEEAVEKVWHELVEKNGASKFTGYEAEEGSARVTAIVKGGQSVDRASEGEEVAIVVDVTPFYGESGGQVGDQGRIAAKNGEFSVQDTHKPVTGMVAHAGKVVRGEIAVGDAVKLEVDHALRTATRRNHSATHLLHWALRTVLGETATQKGSLVGPDRLRFDFAHGKALSEDDVRRIEDLVNDKVLGDAPVQTEVLPIDEAKKRGAMAIFEEKYGDVVRVLTMTRDSVELCGGTHARALGEIGLFKIVSDSALAAGVRRIEAVTGLNALAYVRAVEARGLHAAQTLGVGPSQLAERAEKIVAEKKALEREVADLKRKVAMGGGGGRDYVQDAREIPGGKALAVRADVADAATLREMAEKLRDKLGPSVVLVGAAATDKAMLVLTVSKELTEKFKAGDLIRSVAEIVGGKGGGRPDMAQAGGPDVGKLDEALASLYARLS
ncbi:MAG TPA: alanine--tRNA ligase [Polyangiaceae bacterium]|jgi:alanyl-tRNA synthetase